MAKKNHVASLSDEQLRMRRTVDFLRPLILRELPQANRVHQLFKSINNQSTTYQIAAAHTAFQKLPGNLMRKVLCGWTLPKVEQVDLVLHRIPALKIEFSQTEAGQEGSLQYGVMQTNGAGITISVVAGTSQAEAVQVLEAVLHQFKTNWRGLPGQASESGWGLRLKKTGDGKTPNGATFEGNTMKSQEAAA